MRALQSIVASVLIVVPLNCGHAQEGVVTEKTALPIRVDNVDVQLETEIVKPAGKDQFPLVLIVNGSTTTPRDAKSEWLERLARDFAHRGWLAASILWPGYGASTGVFRDDGGDCSSPHVASFFDARQGELAAALADLKKRDDVDQSTTMGLGFSIGGASMLALAAQPDHPLNAVINISGGLYHYDRSGDAVGDCALFRDDLVKTISSYGKNGKIPTLWVYAANDPFFPPEIAQKMVSSYKANGGKADFNELPPFERNGHTLFKDTASTMINPLIESFIVKNNLPRTHDEHDEGVILRLEKGDRASIDRYLASSTEKAIAETADGHRFFWTASEKSVTDAQSISLSKCKSAGGIGCHIVAENEMMLISTEK